MHPEAWSKSTSKGARAPARSHDRVCHPGRIRPPVRVEVVMNRPTDPRLCYNLPELPLPDERNTEYASKLRSLAQRIGLPNDYVASIQ
jgi:hypothetical protein